MKIGDFLKHERLKLDLSLREVAKQIRTSHSYISRIENGTVDHPSIYTVYRLAELYKISVDLLLELHFKPARTGTKEQK